MKKTNHLFLCLLALSAFLLASCKQEMEKLSESPARENVCLTVTSRLPSSRATSLIDPNNDGRVQIDWKAGEKITARALLINQNNLSFQRQEELSGVIQKKNAKNEFIVTFAPNNPLRIAPETLASGKWFIRILFYLQDTRVLPANSATRVNTAYTDPSKINAPIACPWTELSFSSKDGLNLLKPASPATFSPIGSVLSFKLQPSQEGGTACDSIVFLTDLFTTSDSLSLPGQVNSFDLSDNTFLGKAEGAQEGQSLKLSTPYNESGKAERYYFWCMPNPTGGTRIQAQLFAKGDDSPSYITNNIKKKTLLLKSGKTYDINFNLQPVRRVVPLILHSNYGADELITLYEEKNKSIPISALKEYADRFTISGATFRGWSDTPQESFDNSAPNYPAGSSSSITPNKRTHLFAVWTIDQTVNIPSSYKDKAAFAKGITPPLPSDWVKMVSGGRTIPWKKGCGWYHTYQYGDLMCWAATTSNILLWWMDRNKKNIEQYKNVLGKSFIDHYNELHSDFKKLTAKDMEYGNSRACGVYNGVFKTYFENEDGHTSNAFPWFISGFKADDNGVITGLKEEYNKRSSGGFFKDIFSDKYSIPMKRITYFRKRGFNLFISQALHKGYAMSFETKNHAWNLWGAHFDKMGYVDTIYVTDSRSNGLYQTIDGREDGIGDIPVVYKRLQNGEEQPQLKMSVGTTGIYSLSRYSPGEQAWETYFQTHKPANTSSGSNQ